MITYLDHSRVTAATSTTPPRNPYATGYGPKIPTQYMLQLDSRGPWRRVYVMQYSNSGSAYVLLKGKVHHLHMDTEHLLQELPLFGTWHQAAE